jgi:tetratricopeptide (TPR) repeat protein
MQRLNGFRTAIVVGSILALSNSAYAQTPGPPPDGNTAERVVDLDAVEAKKAFEAGVAAYQKEDFAEAAKHFAQAQLLKPHPEVLLNLAQSQLRAQQYVEAATHFQAYLLLSPQPNATASAGLADAKTQVIEVTIVAPAQAPVIVDNTQVGIAPLPQPLFLVPGSHTVAASDRQQALSDVAGKSITVDLTQGAESPPVATPKTVKTVSEEGSPTRLPIQQWFVRRPGAWVGVGVAVGSLAFSGIAAVTAGRRYDSADQAKNQILAHYEQDGSPQSSPCGPPVATRAYERPCAFYADKVDAGDTWKTTSIVTLAIGVVAAGATVAYYFLDPENAAAPKVEPKVGYNPVTREQQYGLTLRSSF